MSKPKLPAPSAPPGTMVIFSPNGTYIKG